MPYYAKDPKRDHSFDNHPNAAVCYVTGHLLHNMGFSTLEGGILFRARFSETVAVGFPSVSLDEAYGSDLAEGLLRRRAYCFFGLTVVTTCASLQGHLPRLRGVSSGIGKVFVMFQYSSAATYDLSQDLVVCIPVHTRDEPRQLHAIIPNHLQARLLSEVSTQLANVCFTRAEVTLKFVPPLVCPLSTEERLVVGEHCFGCGILAAL